MFQNPAKRAARRAFPISAYVGANGGGKSLAMVWDTLPSLDAGRPVLSTVRLLDYRNPRDCEGCDDPNHLRPTYGPVLLASGDPIDATAVDLDPSTGAPELLLDEHGLPVRRLIGEHVHRAAHPMWVRFTDWEQLLNARACDVLLDEVTGVASSRESMGLPAAVANKLVQLRRADVVVRWSSPAWARADKIIRETSQSATFCVGRMPKSRGTGSDGQDRLWRQRRLFTWRTYDAASFEDLTSGKRDQLRPEVRDLHWGPNSPAFLAYDTYDAVDVIGTVSETGRCYRCGGTRRAPACSCDKAPAAPRNSGPRGRGPREAGATARPEHDCTEPAT